MNHKLEALQDLKNAANTVSISGDSTGVLSAVVIALSAVTHAILELADTIREEGRRG